MPYSEIEMFLADFHMHTTYSDGQLRLPELVDFFGRRGFGAIAITDHLCEEKTLLGKAAAYLNRTLNRESFSNYMDEIREEAKRAWRKYRLLVIPGIEYTKNSLRHHRSAHIIQLGVTEYIPADLEIKELLYQIKHAGGISVAAHPISRKKIRGGKYFLWDQREELSKLFDAWEMTDGGELLSEVARSKLPKIASSDLHRTSQLNSWKSLFHVERSQEKIFNAIRKQDLNFRYYEDPSLEFIPSPQVA